MANPNLEILAEQVKTALDKAGYEVKRGKPYLWGPGGCEKVIPAFGNCFGNNPAAPYIIPIVPHAQDEAYRYGPSMQWGENTDGDALYATFRMQPDEAILTLGYLPPPAAYLGYETFLFTRHFDPECIQDAACPPEQNMDWLSNAIGLQRQLSPNPDTILYEKAPNYEGEAKDSEDLYSKDLNRAQLFANMGPTINNKVLGKTFSDGECWQQQAVLLTSADKNFEGKLKTELGNLGSTLADHCVSNPLGADLRMGLSEDADDFWTVMRYAVPVDSEAGGEWRANLEDQLVVFRATPSVPNNTVDRYEIQTFPEKTFNTDERELAVDLQKVANEVQANLSFGLSPQEVLLPTSQIPLFGPVAVSQALNNLGATHDTDTYRLSSARDFENQAAFAVVGVNHVYTENASYVSVGVYNSEILTGLFSISEGIGSAGPMDGPLTGSVQEFFDLTGTVPVDLAGIDLDNFYVHILMRPDADIPDGLEGTRLVTVVQTSDDGLEEGEPSIGLATPIRVSQRAYLNPKPSGNFCGADPQRTLSPILLTNRPAADK